MLFEEDKFVCFFCWGRIALLRIVLFLKKLNCEVKLKNGKLSVYIKTLPKVLGNTFLVI